jgi:hypothetical protein
MIQCCNPDCGLTVVDNDSMYRDKPIQIKGDINTEPYSAEMTCKICGAELEETNKQL